MDEKTRKTFLLWSKRPEFKAKVDDSTNIIRQYIDVGKCIVAYSGGKDSTIMLHLALQVDPDVDVFLWDQGSYLMPREVHNEILGNAKKLGCKNLIVESASVQENSGIASNPFLWGVSHRAHYAVIGKLKRERGWQTQFVGLRSEESYSRKRVCSRPRKGEVYPLDCWSWRDVWAYIVSRNLPYPRLYDVYGPLLGWDKARFVNFFSKRFENLGAPYLDGFFFPQYRNQK
jgi:3'-phosphoadenosine 5'-phosphosulfate sulfotransferase (PAPS reductase)/FAD synthetase